MNIDGTLNDRQQEAVYATEGPVLILAGAGSGKTRVLTHRAAYLIEEKGINPWNIMAITFTNKAAAQMRERIDKIVGFGSESIWVSTFHSTCVRILRRHIDRLGYDNNFTIYDTDDQKVVMKEVCKKLQVNTKIYKEKMFLNAISHAKDELITYKDMEFEAGEDFGKKRIAQVYKEYQKRLKNNNALDFDDLIVKAVELFSDNSEILDYYQERFKYIMVDEYQDTNTAQFKLINMLASKYNNICVVGDDDQSIYKFRGANIENILNFEKVFKKSKVIKLEQNYRSTKNILKAANSVISNNYKRKQKSLWTDNDEGVKIDFRQFDNAYEEAEFIADDISKKVHNKEIEFLDCAILYRTNAQSRLFEERFVVSNIPYKIIGGINFYGRKEIKDILAYLKTVDNGKDDLAVKRIINIPKRGIGATTLSKVQNYADENDISFYEALKNSDCLSIAQRTLNKINEFINFIDELRQKLPDISIKQLMDEIFEVTGYVRELELEKTDDAAARIQNIEEFVNKIVDYEGANLEASLSGFLEEVALIADIDTLEEDSNYVVLMTLHSAKGLEFPNVYMAGMEDGMFPNFMTLTSEDPTELEEERRLCYVGITRAKQKLTMTTAKQRMVRGESQYCKVSRFVKEIPDEVLGEQYSSFIRSESKPKPVSQNYEKAKSVFKAKPFDLKQFKVTKADSLDYIVGDIVTHVKFGIGTVENIVEGGRDYEVTVNFDRVGVKKMFASFAKLKKI